MAHQVDGVLHETRALRHTMVAGGAAWLALEVTSSDEVTGLAAAIHVASSPASLRASLDAALSYRAASLSLGSLHPPE